MGHLGSTMGNASGSKIQKWRVVGPKIQKWAKAPRSQIKKNFWLWEAKRPNPRLGFLFSVSASSL